MNNPLDIKENYEHALDFSLRFPLGGLLLCLRVINVNSALVTSDKPKQERRIVGNDLTKLLAETRIKLLQTIGCRKSSTSNHKSDILYTNSQDMIGLLSTVVSRCYKCCTDGSNSPGNYGYHLVCFRKY
jgi:hypothetical protein